MTALLPNSLFRWPPSAALSRYHSAGSSTRRRNRTEPQPYASPSLASGGLGEWPPNAALTPTDSRSPAPLHEVALRASTTTWALLSPGGLPWPCCPSPRLLSAHSSNKAALVPPHQSRRPLDGELLRAGASSRPPVTPPRDHQQPHSPQAHPLTPGPLHCLSPSPPPACLAASIFDLPSRWVVLWQSREVWVTQQHGTAIFKMGSLTRTYCIRNSAQC